METALPVGSAGTHPDRESTQKEIRHLTQRLGVLDARITHSVAALFSGLRASRDAQSEIGRQFGRLVDQTMTIANNSNAAAERLGALEAMALYAAPGLHKRFVQR